MTLEEVFQQVAKGSCGEPGCMCTGKNSSMVVVHQPHPYAGSYIEVDARARTFTVKCHKCREVIFVLEPGAN